MNVNHKNKDNNKKRWYVFFTSNYKRSEAKNKKESKWLFTEEKCFVYKLKLSEVCYAEVHLFSPFSHQNRFLFVKKCTFHTTLNSALEPTIEIEKWKLTWYDYIGGLDHDFWHLHFVLFGTLFCFRVGLVSLLSLRRRRRRREGEGSSQATKVCGKAKKKWSME